MTKKTSFRLTACKGTSRARGKILQGVAPQSDFRIDKEEGYDVELRICNNDNHALVHKRERKIMKLHLKMAMKLYLNMTTHHLRIMVKDLSAFKLTLNSPWCLLVCRYRCL